MSCSSAIYAANTNPQTLTANVAATVNFGQIVRAFGAYTNLSGGNVVINNAGYYVGDTNFTIKSTAGAIVTVRLYKDGVLVPGATATSTVGTGATEISLSIPFMIRNTCCAESTITAVVTSTAAGTIENAAILIRKV